MAARLQGVRHPVSRGLLFAAIGAIVMTSGCSCEKVDEDDVPVGPVPYAEIVASQNERMAELQTMFLEGVVELEWVDTNGKRHREPQVDVEAWLVQPVRLAVHLYKIDDLFWIGCDEERYWYFDLISEQTQLVCGLHTDVLDDMSARGAVLPVHPLALQDLMGLVELPETPDRTDYDAARKAWVIDSIGRSGTVRTYFDPETFRPVRVETLDADGAVRMHADLDRYKGVEKPGRSALLYPRTAHRVEISEPDGRFRAVLFFDYAHEGDADEFARMINFERMRGAFVVDLVDCD